MTDNSGPLRTPPFLLGLLAALAFITVAPRPALAAGQVASPATIVPLQACAFGSIGTEATPCDTSHPLPVGKVLAPSAAITTPSGTTAYASGDLIANSATAGSVTPLSFTVCRDVATTGIVRRARIKTPDTGFAAASVRLHLYKTSPTVANGDNGAFSSTESNWIGNVDVTLDQVFSDPMEKGIGVPVQGSEISYDCAAGSQVIYGLLEARGAYTPLGAKAWTVVLEAWPN